MRYAYIYNNIFLITTNGRSTFVSICLPLPLLSFSFSLTQTVYALGVEAQALEIFLITMDVQRISVCMYNLCEQDFNASWIPFLRFCAALTSDKN